jgi:hypothetical protein
MTAWQCSGQGSSPCSVRGASPLGGRLRRALTEVRLAETTEPQPEPQRDLDAYEQSRISADAAPPTTCTDCTQANLHRRAEVVWGSGGRRFKSCQPDSRKLQVRGRVRRDPERPLTAFWGSSTTIVATLTCSLSSADGPGRNRSVLRRGDGERPWLSVEGLAEDVDRPAGDVGGRRSRTTSPRRWRIARRGRLRDMGERPPIGFQGRAVDLNGKAVDRRAVPCMTAQAASSRRHG